ncbi:MAG: glycosyltransferase [Traorella sp.]
MNKNPLVSIIVPVYNAQKSIVQCVDSILKQSYSHFELLLIDDGSSDNSPMILDEYAASDSRIKVVHQKNAGVSFSRNLAIQMAQGEYLQFVDADDWLLEDATKTLIETMYKYSCDMVICDFYRVIDNRIESKGSIQKEGLLTREEFALFMMEKPADFYYGVLWNKLYKKSIIQENQIYMEEDISWSEDFIFNLNYIRYVNHIYVSQVPIYYYVKTKHSLTSQGVNFAKTVQMKVTVFEYYHKFFKDILSEEDYEKYKYQIYRFLFDAASDGSVSISLLPEVIELDEDIESYLTDQGKQYFNSINIIHMITYSCYQKLMLKYHLEIDLILLVAFLNKNRQIFTRKEMADYLGCSTRKISNYLQKLKMEEYISYKDVRLMNTTTKISQKALEIHFLPASFPLLSDIKSAKQEFYQKCFTNFSKDEIKIFHQLMNKLEKNLSKLIVNESKN